MIVTTGQASERASGARAWLWLALTLIIVPFLLLIGLQSFEALNRSPQAIRSEQLVTHSFETILTLGSLRDAIQDAERGQRGYLLTGNAAYLAPYEAALKRVPRLQERLRELTASEPAQEAALTNLNRTIAQKINELRHTVEIYNSAGRRAAEHIVRTNAGLDWMRRLEEQINRLSAHENRLLKRRLVRAAAADKTVQQYALASSWLAAILMMIGVILLVLAFRRTRELQQEVMRRAESSDAANRELAQRNIELARSSEEARVAREEAQRAERTKGRFLATASHDLRQPLQAVSLLNGAMRRRAVDPELIDALQQQAVAVGTIGRLLSALLDISKLEAGVIKPELGHFSVAGLLATMVREFDGVAAAKGLTMQAQMPEPNVFFYSDLGLVEQILRNLTSNAIKYTRTGSVRLCAKADSTGITIEVIDTGVGIATDQIRHIGEEFYQIGVPTNSTREGYGLGMSIVRRLVALLQISLEISSEVGRGSTFALRLPQGSKPEVVAERSAAEGPAPQVARARAARILLVEDDPDVRNATRLLLKSEGYAVVTAACCDDALQIAQSAGEIDLLVTDFHLGANETGTQVIARLREERGGALKVILITGDTSSAIRDLAHDRHLRMLSKPVRAEEFLRLASDLLAL